MNGGLPRAAAVALRWLERALAAHPAGASMVGDLLEDYHELAGRSRPGRASFWLCRQALLLGLGYVFFRSWQRLKNKLEATLRALEIERMIEALSPRGWISDTRQAVRALGKDLGLVFFSTLVTGLGVGATTAVFSVMNPLLLQPLPFEQPERLVWIANDAGEGRSGVTSRTSNLRDFRRLSSTFEAIGGYNAFFEQASYTLTGEGEPERLAGVGVTGDFLDVLGVEPLIGRNFTAEEGERWDDSAILLSHDFWQRRFAGDRSVVGRTLRINGSPSQVIGVLPPSFDFASIFSPSSRVDLLTTFPINDESDRWGNTVSMVGRLAPGAGLEQARSEMAVILRQLEEADPARWGLAAEMTPLREVISGDHRTALLLLFGAAASVLLIVCVNLSGLLLSKGIRRRGEMSLRAALGAPRGRLLRLAMIESLLLSGGGALVGIGLAHLITRAVAESRTVAIPLLENARVDVGVLAFSCLVTLLTGVAIGLLPALQASGAASAGALRASGRTLTSGRGARWLREGLVVAEVAVAGALLVVGGLLLQSFSKVLEAPLGFQPSELAAWLIDTDRDFESHAERVAFFSSVVEQVGGVPGVRSVGLTDAIPLGINRSWTLDIAGRELEPDERPGFFPHIVDQHYLQTMRIGLVAGRGFEASDDLESERVALINESAARAYFGGPQAALGHALELGEDQVRIVGVAADVRHLALEKGSGPELYLPMAQSGDFGTLDLVVRSELPLDAVRGGVAAALRAVDPHMPTNDVRTLGSVVDRAVSPRRFTLSLLTGFAATAILLAALGIYGMLSYSVAERSREIAIRMALGEGARQVRGRVLGRTLALAGAGAIVGLALSIAASRTVASMLYGVEPTDAGTLLGVPLLLLAVAALAGLLPALRASKVDALRVLHTT